jgi:hypothetical protein
VTTIRTPYGIAPDADDLSPLDARLLALCGEQEVQASEMRRLYAAHDALLAEVADLRADVAHQGAELGRAFAMIDALRRGAPR